MRKIKKLGEKGEDNMKVYLSMMKGFEGDIARPLLEKLILTKGHEITDMYRNADLILKHVDKDQAELYVNRDKTVVFYIGNDGKPVFMKSKKGKLVPKSIKVAKQREIEYIPTVLSSDKVAVNIVKFLAGKIVSTEENAELYCIVNEVVECSSLMRLMDIALTMTATSKAVDKKKISYMRNLKLTEEELYKASIAILGTTSYEDNQFTRLLRKIKYFYDSNVKQVIPNISDNVFVNILQICKFKLYATNTRDESKIANYENIIEKANNSILVTVRESLVGSKAFKKYSLDDKRQMGVYSLFICDNSLENNEIMIPHPSALGVSRKNYPKIGDTILDARHPITTVIGSLKVKAYTKDCSIRVNSYVALCQYGDADGDAHACIWSELAEALKFDEESQFNNFGKTAGIKLEDSEYKFTDSMWQEIQEAELPEEEKCIEKSSSSGLEQAEAKLVTKTVTGTFGAVERDVAQTLICNKVKSSMEVLHRKSWLSQIPVQAKNLLADLRSGKELDDLTKQTLKLYCEMQESEIKARKGIKALLDLSDKEAIKVINDLYDRKEKATISKEIEDEILFKEAMYY